MDNLFFNGKMKLADLISANHYLILMLPRFGIPLGFGDKSVTDICKKRNIPVDFFLLICNVYSFDSYLPTLKEIKTTDMSLLVPYLKASHKYYMQERLPHIERHLKKIADSLDARLGNVLMRFFSEYKNEVAEHFDQEENDVFPYMESLRSGTAKKGLDILHFADSHSNIEDKLNDLTQIIFKYLPENVMPEASIEIVFDIFQLSSDLNKHTLIEERILVPFIEMLEKEVK